MRRAFILLFDAEWINRSLFNGAYKRTQSFFERSELSSHGRPADARERALLAPFPQYVQARGARRHLSAARNRRHAATTAPTCRPPISCSPKPATSSKDGRLVKGGVPLDLRVPGARRASRSG